MSKEEGENAEKLRNRRQAKWILAPSVILILILFVLGGYLVEHFYIRPESAAERNELLRTIAQIAGAIFLGTGLFYTHRTVENSSKSLEHQRKSQQENFLRQTREEQDERFFKAVELLGSEQSTDARIGALFALERLSQDSDVYYHQVVEVLCTFVRRRSDQDRPNVETCAPDDLPAGPHDIHVAMTILGRRKKTLGRGEQTGLNLTGANLCRRRLEGAEFQLADLTNSILVGSNLSDCNFSRAILDDAAMQKSFLDNCILIETRFHRAKLERATIQFSKWLRDPSGRVALHVTSGAPPNEISMYSLESSYEPGETVNCGRYLDDSVWWNAELTGATFMDLTLLFHEGEEDNMDMSHMKMMSREQFESCATPKDALEPDFISIMDFDSWLADKKDGSSTCN